ncbi:MAG: hypothetical protein RL189_1837 [Pseudomonadota bacterium]|jgi:hypothetical protein
MAKKFPMKKNRTAKLPSEVRLDASGRLSLGKGLGGRLFKVVTEGDEIRLIPARVFPDGEAWFFENQDRVKAMDRSLAQANAGALEEMSVAGIFDL